MRKDIFLHFLNRDSREICGLYQYQDSQPHFDLLRVALNAAVLLCEDRCIAPPGFMLEDEIAFGLAESQTEYLRRGILQFPIRESGLEDYAEKKRGEYSPMRDRYSGLFSDTRIGFLGKNASGLISRSSLIGESILIGWQQGVDKKSAIWTPVKKLLSGAEIEKIRSVPLQLTDAGTALTWSAMEPHFSRYGTMRAGPQLRNALQNIYFGAYCKEFDLAVLVDIYFMREYFSLPTDSRIYSFLRFQKFLEAFSIGHLLLNGSARFVAALKYRPGAIAFVDAYAQLSSRCKTVAELTYSASMAAAGSKYPWGSVSSRFEPSISEPAGLEMYEFDDGLAAAAQVLSHRYGLERRQPPTLITRAPVKSQDIGVKRMTDIVIYVALQEELDELAKVLSLKKLVGSPAAEGEIAGTPVQILCPKRMGRVAAAVEVAAHLEGRRNDKPKLLLILGLAGGFKEEGTEPGYIICVETVVDLALRKVVDGEKGVISKFRRRDYTLNAGLEGVLTSDEFPMANWIDASIDKAEWPNGRRPSLAYGKLASVDEVVSSDQWRKQLMDHTEKLLGVEMEAGGVCAAADKYHVPVAMLRVVSDNADPAKADDRWRKIGMRTVAQLLLHLDLKRVVEASAA